MPDVCRGAGVYAKGDHCGKILQREREVMENNVFECKGQLKPGVALKILERTHAGLLVSEYKGFYNPGKCTVTLYPRYNPHARDNSKTGKRAISDMYIKVVQ